MGARSESLFHFTRSLESLKGILSTGFHPRYCLEDLSYLNLEFMALPMVCFCDIPLSRLQDHTAFYGSYGIGMTRDWGARSGLNPLIYTLTTSPIARLMNHLGGLNLRDDHGNPTTLQQDLSKHFDAVAPLVKPVTGKMVVEGHARPKDFYQENEWRYVPPDADTIAHEDFENEREEANRKSARFSLRFSANDIRHIIVSSDSEIPDVVDFIHKALGSSSFNDIKILTTRITSQETLNRDL